VYTFHGKLCMGVYIISDRSCMKQLWSCDGHVTNLVISHADVWSYHVIYRCV